MRDMEARRQELVGQLEVIQQQRKELLAIRDLALAEADRRGLVIGELNSMPTESQADGQTS